MNDHDDLADSARPVADTASALTVRRDEILGDGTIPAVIDHPGSMGNLRCEAGKWKACVGSEDMTCECLLPKTVLSGTHKQAEMLDIKHKCLDHQWGRVGTPIVIITQIRTFVWIAGV